jgi:UTP--glucose-1-phosphate uridylyltransferase
MKVHKVIITAAGWGTRFLPVTRSQSKEMLPIVDKPLIQFAVEEALNSGIEQIIVVTQQGKRSIEDYFDRCFELESFLQQKGDIKRLEEMRKLSSLVDIWYIRQKEQLGLGDAVLTAKNIIGHEPFAVILPDIIIDSRVPALKILLQDYERYGKGIIGVRPVDKKDISRYGIIEPEQVAKATYRIKSLVEKPQPARAPSNLGIIGRYVLPPEIFDALLRINPGKGREIQLTDALQSLLGEQELYAHELQGMHYDCGTPPGWLKANVALALKRKELGAELRDFLRNIV